MYFIVLFSSLLAFSLCSVHQNNFSQEEFESSDEEPRYGTIEREKLDKVYHSLKQDIFTKVKSGQRFKGDYFDVDMESYIVVAEGEIGVATTGLSTCYAVCCIGYREKLKPVLGLAHIVLTDPETVLEKLTSEMINNNCTKESLAFYVIGGSADDESKEVLYDFLCYSKKYAIKGALYNPTNIDEDNEELRSVDVILTKDKILYSENIKFRGIQRGKEF